MNLPKLKRYQKKYEYSYSFGAYPTLDLLKYHPDSVLEVLIKKDSHSSDGVKDIINICKKRKIIIEENDKAIDRISFKENTYVVGIFRKYETKLQSGKNHIVLVNPSNLGNLGTIVRSMVGFNFNNLAIIGHGADIFDPTVVRSTMGGLFHINFCYFETIEDYIKMFPKQNLYPFMLDGAEDIRKVKFVEPLSFIQGNEGSGLDGKYKNIGHSIFIPHSKNIDSLNLSVATSIGLWEFSRRKA